MQYYKFLDLDWKPAAERIREYLLERPELISGKGSIWVDVDTKQILQDIPEINQMFSKYNLDIWYIAFTVMTGPRAGIHVDSSVLNTRINIPILNCDNTETRFWRVVNDRSRRQTDWDNQRPEDWPAVSYLLFEEEDCELVDKYCLTQPSLIRINEPHDIIMYHENYPRIACSIGFNTDIEFLWD